MQLSLLTLVSRFVFTFVVHWSSFCNPRLTLDTACLLHWIQLLFHLNSRRLLFFLNLKKFSFVLQTLQYFLFFDSQRLFLFLILEIMDFLFRHFFWHFHFFIAHFFPWKLFNAWIRWFYSYYFFLFAWQRFFFLLFYDRCLINSKFRPSVAVYLWYCSFTFVVRYCNESIHCHPRVRIILNVDFSKIFWD